MSQQTLWRNYEEVAQFLLGQMASHFGLGRVEGKQMVAGASTSWEVDAKGVRQDGHGFVIIECRRHTKQGVPQEQIAGLAFKIQDTGAAGGINCLPSAAAIGRKKRCQIAGCSRNPIVRKEYHDGICTSIPKPNIYWYVRENLCI